MSLHLIMTVLTSVLTSILTSESTSYCHTPGTPLHAATVELRVTSKRPKNKPGIPADLRSWKLRLFRGGHVLGLKSNR